MLSSLDARGIEKQWQGDMGAAFLLMTGLSVLGILLSLGLPNGLVTRKLGEAAYHGR